MRKSERRRRRERRNSRRRNGRKWNGLFLALFLNQSINHPLPTSTVMFRCHNLIKGTPRDGADSISYVKLFIFSRLFSKHSSLVCIRGGVTIISPHKERSHVLQRHDGKCACLFMFLLIVHHVYAHHHDAPCCLHGPGRCSALYTNRG